MGLSGRPLVLLMVITFLELFCAGLTILKLIQFRKLLAVRNRGLTILILFLIGLGSYSLVYCLGDTLGFSCSQYWFVYTSLQSLTVAAFISRVWNLFALHRIAAQSVAHALDSDNQELKNTLWFLLHKDYIKSSTSSVLVCGTLSMLGMIPTTAYFMKYSSHRSIAYDSQTCSSAYYTIVMYNTVFALLALILCVYLMKKLRYSENFGIKRELTFYSINGSIFLSLVFIFKIIEEVWVHESNLLFFFSRVILPIQVVRALYDMHQCVFGSLSFELSLHSTISGTRRGTHSPRSPTRTGSRHSQAISPRASLRSTLSDRIGTSKKISHVLEDIDFMLSDPKGFEVLIQLAIAEFTVESVMFLKAVAELRDSDLEQWRIDCRKIQSLFILECSPLCLNLSHLTRNQVETGLDQLQAGINPAIFDLAYSEIARMFAYETWGRICRQPAFQQYCLELQQRQIPESPPSESRFPSLSSV